MTAVKKHSRARKSDLNLPFDVPLELKDRALSSTAEGITISDPSLPDNPIIYANSGFERITGYAVKSILGRNCRFLQGPKTDPKAAQKIRDAINTCRECTVDILNYRKDRSTFWNRLSITPVRDAHGRVTHFIGVQSDITARRNSEDRLRAANLKMSSDLTAAAKVQQSMLPDGLPQCEGYRFAWRYRPCEELAGDILNIFRLDDAHVAAYIIDVSGHGLPASLLSVTLNRMLLPIPGQSILYAGSAAAPSAWCITSPHIVAEKLNRQFQFDERNGQFFTFLYGVLDTLTGIFEYISAGHPPLILVGRNARCSELHQEQFPVGVMAEPGYVSDSVRLRPGDRLFAYTDGITEAFNKTGRQYGSKRLYQKIASTRDRPLDAALGKIAESVETFCSGSEIKDDISLLAIEAA